MATDHSKLVEITRDFLSCPVCLDPFTDPRQLPCLHTFCLKCIDKHIKSNRRDAIFECPQCQSQTDVPENGGTGFKTNFFISGLQEVMPSHKDGKVFCDICKDQKVPATSLRVQCIDKLCQECCYCHHRTKLTRDHRILSLEEYYSGSYLEELRAHQKRFCTEHSTKEIELYCKDCKVPVCMLCNALHHNNHSMTTLHDAAASVNQTLRKVTEQLKVKEKLLASGIQQYEIDYYKTNFIEEVTKWAEEIINNVNVMKNETIKEITEITSKEKTDNNAKIESFKQKLQLLTDSIAYCETIIQHGSDIEKLQDNQLLHKLKQMHAINIIQLNRKPIFTLDIISSEITPPQLKYSQLQQPLPYVTDKVQLQGAVRTCSEKQSPDVKCQVPVNQQPQTSVEISLEKNKAHVPQKCEHAKDIVMYRYETNSTVSIACNKSEFLVVSPEIAGISVHNRNGTLQHVIGRRQLKEGSQKGITVDRDNNILVTCSNNIYIYDAQKQQKKVLDIGNLKFPFPDPFPSRDCIITTNSKQEILYVGTDRDVVQVLDYDGNIRQTITSKTLGVKEINPSSLAVNDKDEIILADSLEHCVYIIDAKGNLLHTYKPDGDMALGNSCVLCTDMWGQIIYADQEYKDIHLLSRTGDHLSCLLPNASSNSSHNFRALATNGQGELVLMTWGRIQLYKY